MSNINLLNQFLEGKGKNNWRKPNERYSSFDYCYNYFYWFYKSGKLYELASEQNIQMSCLQIGFYLASWWMLRWSSFLLEKSAKNFSTLISIISNSNSILWEIDVDNYNEENIFLLLQCKKEIINALWKNNKATDTLVTKIMLGVFGNVPAFDQYFRKWLNVHSVNKNSLLKIKQFYLNNRELFDSTKIYTLDFNTWNITNIKYTKAKLVDMYWFINGQ